MRQVKELAEKLETAAGLGGGRQHIASLLEVHEDGER